MADRDLYIGLMSGTSLDGVDAVLADFARDTFRVLAHTHEPFDAGLRDSLLELTVPGPDEIDRAGRLGRVLAQSNAQAVLNLLASARIDPGLVRAIGCHGQTVRHRPDQGFTVQIGNPALVAELTGIAVAADFRSRDMAAGGQGAPLVPAFHAVAFAASAEARVIANIGGIGNVTVLVSGQPVLGYDTGPGNCLMDIWTQRHLGKRFDEAGAWAAGGAPLPGLLAKMLSEPFFSLAPPKSSGRELFNAAWLQSVLDGSEDPRAVQATLLELTAESISRAVEGTTTPVSRLIVCGGGAYNETLVDRLGQRLSPTVVERSTAHGLDPNQVEATAFAWLACQAVRGKPGNLPEVTGAKGPRILGAIYPAWK